MIKILIIALVIYLLVVTRARIRLPHPGLQATVDVLKAADLSDDEVQRMAAQYVRYCDAQNRVAPAGDPYAERLARLSGRYVAVNGIPLNFKVYKTTAVNAFATADGSIRVFSGLMDRLGDDELMAIVGHEMGHVRNHDTIGAMRKAYLASAARSALGAVGGALGALSASQLGSIAEQYASAQFSQGQETLADDFSFGFLIRTGEDHANLTPGWQRSGRGDATLFDSSRQRVAGSPHAEQSRPASRPPVGSLVPVRRM